MGRAVYGQTCIRRTELVYGQTFFDGRTAEHRSPPKSAEIHRKAACTMAMAAELATASCLDLGACKRERERGRVDDARARGLGAAVVRRATAA